MMYRLVSVLAVLAMSGAQQDRTLDGVPSGLVDLLHPQQHQQPQNYQYWDAQPQDPHGGITVQTGYEGIIAPTGPAEPERGTAVGGLGGHLSTLHRLGGFALGASLLTHLLPFPFNRMLHFLGTKLGAWVVGILLLLVVGSAATTAVCAFTPLCTISFLGLRFNRESVRSLLSEDRINSATQFVYDAIAKYKKLQLENREGKTIGKNKNKAKRVQELKEAREYTKVTEQTVAEKRDTTASEHIVTEKIDTTAAEHIVTEKIDATTTEQIMAEKRETTAAREEIKPTTEVLKESTTPSI